MKNRICGKHKRKAIGGDGSYAPPEVYKNIIAQRTNEKEDAKKIDQFGDDRQNRNPLKVLYALQKPGRVDELTN